MIRLFLQAFLQQFRVQARHAMKYFVKFEDTPSNLETLLQVFLKGVLFRCYDSLLFGCAPVRGVFPRGSHIHKTTQLASHVIWHGRVFSGPRFVGSQRALQ